MYFQLVYAAITSLATTTPTNSSPFPVIATIVLVVTGVFLIIVGGTIATIALFLLVRKKRLKQIMERDGFGNTVLGNLNVDNGEDVTGSGDYNMEGTIYLDDEESGIYYSTIKEL